MSLQQSEARRNRAREIDSFDFKRTTNNAASATEQQDGTNDRRRSHRSDARTRRREAKRRLEAEKAEARALGVEVIEKTPNIGWLWTDIENDVIRAMADGSSLEIHKKLPHRSARAIAHQRLKLGLRKPVQLWTAPELKILTKHGPGADVPTLQALLPRWDTEKITQKLRHLGIPRGQAPLRETGNWLCDAIRDRCRVLGYSASQIDTMAHTGNYFQSREWNRAAGHRWQPMVKAAKALGGELRVEWPD